MSNFEKIIYLFLLILLMKLLIYISKKIIFNLNYTSVIDKISYGLVSRKDFCEMPDVIFIDWCIKILEKTGFKNIHILSKKSYDNVQLLAYKSFKKVYIKCSLKGLSGTGSEDNFEKLERHELQKFVGSMEHDNINCGYCLTNGDFTKDAEEYAATLPSGTISLKLLDGCTLTSLHRKTESKGFNTLLEAEV